MIVAGILTPLEDVLSVGLEWLGPGTVGLPWAWAVVALTIVVRMLLVPLTVKQIHSMQKLQRHMPQLKEIQRKYKNDKVRQREEVMRFYRENRVNPAASCLPIVFQIPIFIALYFVLRDFDKEIHSKPQFVDTDLGWLGFVPSITADIGTHWSGYLLVVLYVISQMCSTLLMPTTMDRAQRMILLFLPLAFVYFIVNPPVGAEFPVGLLLYWVTTNLWTVGQGLVTRELVPKQALTPPKRSSRTPPRGDGDAGDGATAEPTAPKPAPAASRPAKRIKRKKKARR